MNHVDYNVLVPLAFRRRLNNQKNICKLQGIVAEDGTVEQPYRYIIGLGERHFRDFDEEILKIIAIYPWLKKKHARFILNEIILNSQFSSLRSVVERVPLKRRVAGFFTLTLHVTNSFLICNLEEYGDYFDYFGYIDTIITPETEPFDSNEQESNWAKEMNSDKLKLILTEENTLRIPDSSNRIALNIIENATDHDFYVTSFYRENRYMWKRIYFRLENDIE